MIGFRSFLNDDPPHLAKLWCTRSGLRGYVQPMTTMLLDRLVLAKPYFDRAGLIMATNDGAPVGFGHAGFGPLDDESALSNELGAAIMVLVAPHDREAEIAAGLIHQCESYLRGQGAHVLYGGGIRPLNAFYVGLYGGSELPGVLDSDPQQQMFFRAAGYREIDRTVVLHRELAGFRPPVDRRQMLIRRRADVNLQSDPPPRTWWEACTLGEFNRMRYRLTLRGDSQPIAGATLIDMETFGHTWGVRTAGLIDVWVAQQHRRQGLALFLISEVMRQATEEGFGLIEVQTMHNNAAALELYHKLGYYQVDSGAVFRKE